MASTLPIFQSSNLPVFHPSTPAPASSRAAPRTIAPDQRVR
jgi:hypothetical protein